MARPRAEIDKIEFEKLCQLQCTEQEICDWFGITDKTLARWCEETYQNENGEPMRFSEVFAQKRCKGKIALRRSMFQLAQKNATLCIFLAKNWLGMSDQVEVKADTSLMEALLDAVNSK